MEHTYDIVDILLVDREPGIVGLFYDEIHRFL